MRVLCYIILYIIRNGSGLLVMFLGLGQDENSIYKAGVTFWWLGSKILRGLNTHSISTHKSYNQELFFYI